jgi:hypothetical protein
MKITKNEMKIFLMVFAISTLFSHSLVWNENSRLDLTRAVIDIEHLTIDNYYNNTSDRAIYNGHYYIEKSPISSFIIAPSYTTWKFIYYNFFNYLSNKLPSNTTIYTISKVNNAEIIQYAYQTPFISFAFIIAIISYSVIPTALTTLLVYKLSSKYLKDEKKRLFITFAYFLATTAFFYSTIFYNHPFPTFLVFLSFFILFSMKKGKQSNILFLTAGILLGTAITNEAALATFFVPFVFYVFLINKRKAPIFIIAVMVGLIPFMIYNYLIFGNPTAVAFKYLDSNVWQGSGLTENYGFAQWPNLFVFLRLLFYPEVGLFFFFPFLLLVPFGFYFMYKESKAECLLILSMFIFITLFISAYKSWFEYESFGPRRIFGITPFLMIPIFFSVKKIDFIFITILFILSTFFSLSSLGQNVTNVYDPFIIPGSLAVNQEAKEKVNSFAIIQNALITHYVPSFIANGPQSSLLESFFAKNRAFDIRDFWPLSGSNYEIKPLDVKIGNISVKISVIAIIFILSTSYIIWKKL